MPAPPVGCKYDGPRCAEGEWQYKLVCPESVAPTTSVVPAVSILPATESAVSEFKIEADDRGFYPDAILFVKKDGSTLWFCTKKCKVSMIKHKRIARKFKWTIAHKAKDRAGKK